MSELIATTQGNNTFKEVSPGMHKARCVRVIDLGTQRQEFSGEISWKRQVLVIWEVPEETYNEMPMTISKFYTLSLHEKSNLGADLTSWRGRAFTALEKQGFDISKLVGSPCLLNVIENEKGRMKIKNVLPERKAEKTPSQVHPSLFFSIDEFQQGNRDTFEELSDGIQNIILKSKELEGVNIDMGDENNGADLESDDVPF